MKLLGTQNFVKGGEGSVKLLPEEGELAAATRGTRHVGKAPWVEEDTCTWKPCPKGHGTLQLC